jgi:hypothetical protein
MRLPWVAKPRRVRHKPLLQAPFVGREALLAALEARLQAAREGTGQYVALGGQAGSGKSALLTEFALMRCATPQVFLVQLNVGECFLEQEFYVRLFGALRARSEKILHTLYNDTKGLRKALAVTWDETEFYNVLTSTDWSPPQESAQPQRRAAASRDPLAQLYTAVARHPWAVGAATVWDALSREAFRVGQPRGGVQRWDTLLHSLQTRRLPPGAVLVILLDQLESGLMGDYATAQRWTQHWQAFAQATARHGLPLLLVWSGTTDCLQPMCQALQGIVPVTAYTVGELDTQEMQQLLPRLLRGLPSHTRTPWQRVVAASGPGLRCPMYLTLATICVAAMAEGQEVEEQALESLVQASAGALVGQLVRAIIQRYPAHETFVRQLVEVCAFLPPGKDFTLDDLLLLCDLDTLQLDIATARATLETLIGEWVRYGLLGYDPYTSRYSTGSGMMQQALQALASPGETERQVVAWRRRLAAAIMHHVQHGAGDILRDLAQLMHAQDGEQTLLRLAPYVVAPLRRVLLQSTKAERRRIASALGQFPSALAVELLTGLLRDEDGQVRSRAVQSLADLQGLETLPALLQALRDSDGDVRWIAACALGKIEGVATVDALVSLLADEDKEVGRIAAEGLGQKGDRRAVPHLIAAMRDSYPLLRESAALALGQLADKRALPALQELLQDANLQVRRSAESALARLQPASC